MQDWYVAVEAYNGPLGERTYCDGIRVRERRGRESYSDEHVVETDSGNYPPRLETGAARLIAAAPALARALLSVEWEGDDSRFCPDCGGMSPSDPYPQGHSVGHADSCALSRALTDAGFATRASRDAARKLMAESERC
jgi:hypothetical protein